MVLPRLRGALAKLAGDAARARAHRPHALVAGHPLLPRATRRRRARGPRLRDARSRPSHQAHGDARAAPRVRRRRQARDAARGRRHPSTRAATTRTSRTCAARRRSRRPSSTPGRASSCFPGFGACSVAATAREADIALDVYEHTIEVMTSAAEVGTYAPCTRADLFDVEYWSLEQAKLKPAAPAPLARCIALVTGAAERHRPRDRRAAARAGRARRAARSTATSSKRSSARSQRLAKGRKERVLMIVADVRDEGAAEGRLRAHRSAPGEASTSSSRTPATRPRATSRRRRARPPCATSLELNCLSHARVARACAIEVMLRAGPRRLPALQREQERLQPGPGLRPVRRRQDRPRRPHAPVRRRPRPPRASARTPSTPTASARPSSAAASSSRARRPAASPSTTTSVRTSSRARSPPRTSPTPSCTSPERAPRPAASSRSTAATPPPSLADAGISPE